MNIIFNHTLNSIKKNKGQIAMIIVTIVVVVIMLFCSLSFTDMFYNLNIKSKTRLPGDAEISLKGGELFSKSQLEDFVVQNENQIEYADCFLQIGSITKTKQDSKIIMLEICDMKNLLARHENKISVKQSAKDYEYQGIWIGEDFSKVLGVSAGDAIEIYNPNNQRYEKFSIANIMKNKGYFADSNVNNVMIDFSSINYQGMINIANIKLKNEQDFEQVVIDLKNFMANNAIEIESSVDYVHVNEVIVNNSRLLNISLIFIITMMILILFTSYLVISKNRYNEMVIFKAAGATPLQILFIMLLEVVVYGIIGSAIGILLGRLLMGLAVKILLPSFPGAITYEVWKYFAAFFIGIFISILSAIFPIVSVCKNFIRQLTSGIIKDIKYIHPIYILVTSIVLITCVLLIIILEKFIFQITLAMVIVFAFWLFGVVPYIIRFFSFIFSRFKKSKLASITIKRNSSSQTLSTLIGAVITFSFIVITVINLVVIAIKPFNSRFYCDYVISSTEEIDYSSAIERYENIEGIEDAVYFRNAKFEIDTGERELLSYNLIGISSNNALYYCTKGLSEDVIKEFNDTPHPIIINKDMALRLNLDIGDKFAPAREKSSANITYTETLDNTFTVIGIENSASEYDRVMYVKFNDMISQGKNVDFDNEMIFLNAKKGEDKQNIFLALRDFLSNEQGKYVLKFNDWAYGTSKGLQGVITLLNIIQIMVSIVAFVGVINLSIITVYDRKKELYIYKVCGMDKNKYQFTSLFEGAIVGLTGGIIGICLSFFFNLLMPSFSKIINKFIEY